MCSPSQLPQIHSIQFRTLAIQVNLQVRSWTRLKVSLGHLSHWLLYIVKYLGKYFPSRGNGISYNLPLIGFHGHWTWKTLTILGNMFPRSSQKLKIALRKAQNYQKQIYHEVAGTLGTKKIYFYRSWYQVLSCWKVKTQTFCIFFLTSQYHEPLCVYRRQLGMEMYYILSLPLLLHWLIQPTQQREGQRVSLLFLTGLVHCSGPDRIQYNAPVSKMALYRIQ